MSDSYTYPFSCFRCEKEDPRRFAIDPVSNDYLIAYPEINLIHLHLGVSSHTPEENLANAKFVREWWDSIARAYPTKIFFFINDLSRKDDSETLEDEAKADLAYVRNHPQAGGAAAYGQTYAMNFLMNLLNVFTKKTLSARNTLDECEQEYNKWYENPTNRTLQ